MEGPAVQTSAIKCRGTVPGHGREMDTPRAATSPRDQGSDHHGHDDNHPADRPRRAAVPSLRRWPARRAVRNCGWERGLIVAYQKDMGDRVEIGFAAEKRHKMMLWSGLLACGSGVILLIWGIAHGGAAIAAGSCWARSIYRRGARPEDHQAWAGLVGDTWQREGPGHPGLIIGGGFGLTVLLPATLLAFGVMALFFNALGDVKSTIRACG